LEAEGTLQLIGNNSARSAVLRASGNILDGANTDLTIEENVNFFAAAIYLADGEFDELTICGHANFNVNVFASVHRNGTATLGSWRVNGANSWINPDSRVC
jgi:hypothetical protein